VKALLNSYIIIELVSEASPRFCQLAIFSSVAHLFLSVQYDRDMAQKEQ